MNILIIEDNEQNIYLERYLLEARGHHVSEARDGPAGIAAARAVAPELILLDIQMPGMDGYAVARMLRTLPTLDTVPIVVVTSYAMSGDRAKALLTGCDAYIEKPINPHTFVADVEAAGAGSRSKEQAIS